MEIFVFRTGLHNEEQVKIISPHLNSVPGIHKWNVDLDDSEKILRIEADGISPGTIESVLGNADYFCEELPD